MNKRLFLVIEEQGEIYLTEDNEKLDMALEESEEGITTVIDINTKKIHNGETWENLEIKE